MIRPATVYAIAASGLFVTFAFPAALCIWWRRRLIKAQRAYTNSILETTPTSVGPGVHIDPFDYVTPVLGNAYPNKPGSGNAEFSSSDQDPTLTSSSEGDKASISPLPSLSQKPKEPYTQPPPAYTEV